VEVCRAIPGVAFISNADDHSISVVDVASRTLLATVPVGDTPWGVAVDPAGTRAYVSNRGTDDNPLNTVSVVGAVSRSVSATVEVGVRPLGVAVHPDGTRAYVANYGGSIGALIDDLSNDFISVIDTNTHTASATIPVGVGPAGLTVSPNGTRLYVTNYADDTVSVVDTATNTVVVTVPVGSRPLAAAVHPSGDRVYVGNFGTNSVSVIGTVSNSMLATITVGQSPFGIAVEPESEQIYVANMQAGTVSVIDATTNTVSVTIDVGGSPMGLAIDAATRQVYVVSRGTNEVSVIDAATNTIRATVPSGQTPVALGMFIGVVKASCTTPPLSCQDRNPFTPNECAPSTGCRGPSLTGSAAATEGVRSLASTIDQATADGLVDAETAGRLDSIIETVEEDLAQDDEVPVEGEGAPARVRAGQTAVDTKALRRAAKELSRFIRQARKHSTTKRHRAAHLRPDVAMTLVDVARATRVELRRARKPEPRAAIHAEQRRDGPGRPRRHGLPKPPPPR
jgi:YVTN family beta-propeller protein